MGIAENIPLIDIGPLVSGSAKRDDVARRLGEACREHGFFYVVGHGVDDGLCQRLEALSREFFSRSTDEKLRINMAAGGRAWRGYFRVGDELTSGKPDQKEGIYFGQELPDDHPAVVARTPLHGRNLWPEVAGFRETVLEYLAATTQVGHHLSNRSRPGLKNWPSRGGRFWRHQGYVAATDHCRAIARLAA